MLEPRSVFLITGAAQGVGRAAAELVVSKGHRVVACDIQAEPIEELCGRLGKDALAVPLDIRDSDGWARAFDRADETFGGVDVLVNNAAVLHSGYAIDVPWDDIQATVDVNLLGVMKGIRTAVPRLISQGKGHIVTVGSFLSFIPLPGLATYSATKHGLRAFVNCCSLELYDTPVSFTMVYPAAIETPMLDKQIDDDSVSLSFSDATLTAGQVAEAIYRAAVEKPDEIMVPPFRGKTLKLASVSQGILRLMLPSAMKRGRKRQAQLRAMRGN
jgi:short-subunit dehydrogenase